MRLSFIILFIIVSHSLHAQDLHTEPRELRIWEDTRDTIVEKLKLNRNGDIKILHQEYLDIIQDTTYYTNEYYKKDKYWFILRYKECLANVKGNISTYELKQHGKQYSFNPNGTIYSIDDYTMDIKKMPTQYFIYYPSGNLKYIAETTKSKITNFIAYYYPNGDIYDYGDFKNGVGTFTHLNDEGEPCTVCTFEDGKYIANELCPDDLK